MPTVGRIQPLFLTSPSSAGRPDPPRWPRRLPVRGLGRAPDGRRRPCRAVASCLGASLAPPALAGPPITEQPRAAGPAQVAAPAAARAAPRPEPSTAPKAEGPGPSEEGNEKHNNGAQEGDENDSDGVALEEEPDPVDDPRQLPVQAFVDHPDLAHAYQEALASYLTWEELGRGTTGGGHRQPVREQAPGPAGCSR